MYGMTFEGKMRKLCDKFRIMLVKGGVARFLQGWALFLPPPPSGRKSNAEGRPRLCNGYYTNTTINRFPDLTNIIQKIQKYLGQIYL